MVFPAPAGINRLNWPDLSCLSGVPRASGDKPVWGMMLIVKLKCSPRQRG
ncbi:hypothetical protein HWF18_003518 [Salmonella enterica]|nr:hypothetical protein [Salmonella enterica]